MRPPFARRVPGFGTALFSGMSRPAVRLGRGFPDFDGPEQAKDAAIAAIRAGENQYAVGIGRPGLRHHRARRALPWANG